MPTDQLGLQTVTTPNAAWHALSFLPTFDGQTIVSIILGAALTIVTFWFGYRKTIGAQDERTRAATSELCSSVIKRIAVEREVMTSEQFAAIRQAKAHKAQVQSEKLVDFYGALNTVLLETIDNNFLDNPSKNAIIGIIEKSREGSAPAVSSTANSRDNAREKISALVAASSATLGLIGSLLTFTFSSEKPILSEGIKGDHREVLIVFVASLTVSLATAAILFAYVVAKRRARADMQKS